MKSRIKELYTFEGLGKTKVESAEAGDICAVFGLEDFEIGDTIADFENPEGLTPIKVDEPTISMLFTINNSPFLVKKVNTLLPGIFVNVWKKNWKRI